mgnify:CR=1 FL=1|nr:MAG: hypothetical protein DIU68_04650 [Chloroflexota bacterium]
MTEHDKPLPENEPPAQNPEAAVEGDTEARAGVDTPDSDAEVRESLPDDGLPLPEVSEAEALAKDLESGGAETQSAGSYDTAWDAPEAYAAAGQATYEDVESPAFDFVDIDAALASVAALGEELAEREELERAQLAAEQDAEAAREEAAHRTLKSIQAPPVVNLRRGQLASVVPALLLMGIGAWLTFATTAPDAVPLNPLLVSAALLAAVVITLLAYWLSSGRWARGAFFFAILLVLMAGSVYYASTLDLEAPVAGPLILAATGLAFALTALLSRPMDRRLLLPGILFLVAAAVSLAAIIGYLPATLLAGVAPYWPALVAVIALLWLLPLLAKRRG